MFIFADKLDDTPSTKNTQTHADPERRNFTAGVSGVWSVQMVCDEVQKIITNTSFLIEKNLSPLVIRL